MKSVAVFRNSIIIFLAFFAASSCSSDDRKQDAVARVYDTYLSRQELQRAIPFGLKGDDSAGFADEYINQWVRRNLVLHRAELNLRDEEKDVAQQLEDYRQSLIIFAYERELVKQKLDTVVTEAEIADYYEKHPNNFELKSNIIRLQYIKVPLKTPNIDKARKWFRSEKSEDREKLEQFARLYAVNSLLDDSNWLLLEDVTKEIPLSDDIIGSSTRLPVIIEPEDDKFRYLVRVSGFMVKDSQAPLEFEVTTIKNIILNKRKIMPIEKMQDDALAMPLNEKDIEFYKN
ncbi:MAG: hypothetical protein R2850_07840 [Bacteroidia bacterium]